MSEKKLKVVTVASLVLCGALTFGTIAYASPLAGISTISAVSGTTESTMKNQITAAEDVQTQADATIASSYSTLAGVNLKISKALAKSTAESNIEGLATTVSEGDTVANAPTNKIAVAQVEGYVNMRETPDENGEVLGKLYNNGAGLVVKKDGDWVEVKSGTVTGYVLDDYLEIGNEDLIKEVSRRVATVKTETLYVRQESNTTSSVISMVPEGDDLTVTDESLVDDGWIGVSVEGGDGYVSTDYVALSTEFSQAESKAEETARLQKEAAERAAAAAARSRRAQASSSQSSSGGGAKSYSAPSGSGGSAVVSFATQFVGNPYVYGGSSLTNGTDCSGFVMSVYANFGVSLPHSSSALRSAGYGVSQDQMQPGDIVCYSGHVGIYAGNGNIVHASNKRTGIIVSSAYYRNILAVRRIY